MTSFSNDERPKGLVLLNLGTPDQPQENEVRAYLKEFLMDPRVIDIPYPFRWLLVHGAILPRRPATSAEAYRKIWTDRGSPLYFHLIDLAEKVQKTLEKLWIVQPAMRYGKPSITEAFKKLQAQGISELVVFPLYPQYSLAATESSLQECFRVKKQMNWDVPLKQMGAFYQSELFIDAFVQVVLKSLQSYSYDHLLFSFHGLPERQVKKTENVRDYCLQNPRCCEKITEANSNCYRAQCYRTAQLMAKKIGLSPENYTVCFQSRLGRTPWIKPYTDEFYRNLPKKGVRRVAVVCPAFVSDCLETLEEVQIRGREEFIQNGGEDLKLVPSLNSEESWARAVSQMVLSFSSS